MHQEEEILEDTIIQKGFYYKNFTLTDEIGKGSFGRVMAATHKSSKIEFAIKEMISSEEIKEEEIKYDPIIEKEVHKHLYSILKKMFL